MPKSRKQTSKTKQSALKQIYQMAKFGMTTKKGFKKSTKFLKRVDFPLNRNII